MIARQTAYIVQVTVLEVIQRSTDFLARKGIESARLQTELLLSHLLHMPRMKLYLSFERVLTPAELDQFRELIRRRGQREPLQHITGSTSFCGWEIAVSRHVLIPRPETELLAEAGWTFLSQLTPSPDAARPIAALDFGTGSGCLAIALALNCPGAEICAIDLSPEALTVARANAARHQVENRVRFFESDGFQALPDELSFDLIVANPPYIPTGEIESLQPEVRDYDPRAALDGGADGLDFYRRLAVETPRWLRPGAQMMLEFGDGQAESLRTLFSQQNWIVERISDDYTRRPRILITRNGKPLD